MDRIKLRIHPLFVLMGIFYAITGDFFRFIVYTLTAVIHELGHSIRAGSLGCELNKITLMPFGAVVKGNVDGLSLKDQISVALFGPLVNIAVAILFIAVWWGYPETYAYTDIAAEACLSIGVINLLPIFPLDGGRIITCILSDRFGVNKGEKIARIISFIFAVALFALFVISCFFTVNVSLLFFSAFVIFGAFGKAKENKYVRVFKGLSSLNLKNGVLFKKIGVDKEVTVKKLITLLDYKSINEVAVFDGEEILGVLSQKKLIEIIENGNFYAKIADYL